MKTMHPDDMEFLQLIKRMRDQQAEFFKYKDGMSLNKAKRLEKQVDQKLHEYLDTNKQKKLF